MDTGWWAAEQIRLECRDRGAQLPDGATEEDLEAHRRVFPQPAADAVRLLLSEFDGTGLPHVLQPSDRLLAAREAVRRHDQMVEMSLGIWGEVVVAQVDEDEAGDSASVYSRRWMPVTTNDAGDMWFSDLRQGSRHGRLFRWLRDEGAVHDSDDWRDIGALVDRTP